MLRQMTRDRHAPDVFRPDPDGEVKWTLTILSAGLVLTAVTTCLKAQGWLLWAPLLVFVVAVAGVMPHGFLRRKRDGSAPWALGLAYLLLGGYTITTWWLTTPTVVSFVTILIPVVCLWAAAILIRLHSIRPTANWVGVAFESLFLLLAANILWAVSGILRGVGIRRDGATVFGMVVILTGVLFFLIGLVALLFWVALRFEVVRLRPKGRAVRNSGTGIVIGGDMNSFRIPRSVVRGWGRENYLRLRWTRAAIARPAYPLIQCPPVWVA